MTTVLHWSEVRDPNANEDAEAWELRDDDGTAHGVVYVPLYCDGDGIRSGACHTWLGDEPCQSQGRPYLTWHEDHTGAWVFGPRFRSLDLAQACVEEVTR